MEYSRLKLSIKLKNGKTFHFVTESDSHISTSWLWDISLEQIDVHNANGAHFSFPKLNIEYYDTYPTDPKVKSLSIKEIGPNIFEVSDYIKSV